MSVVLIAHDIRSAHNVGSLLRTADGFGVERVYFTGYTPYPETKNDTRLPHISRKLSVQIHKTALGAELSVAWQHEDEIDGLLAELRRDGYQLVALEQAQDSVALSSCKPVGNVALLIGREVEGIEPSLLAQMDIVLEIPMRGSKESFNVVQATAIALYQFNLG